MGADRLEPPPVGRRPALWVVLAIAFLAALLLSAGGGLLDESPARDYAKRSVEAEPEPVLLPPPPVDDEYFPCSDCHEDEPADPMVRELDEHDNIELKHGDLWCLDCHQSDQRDLLHLSDASPVKMEESWRLCSRCHAKKMPDWRAGVHGKRTGYWQGPKEYQTCVVCHDPHAPLFKALEPKPMPERAASLTAGSISLEAGVAELEEAAHESQ